MTEQALPPPVMWAQRKPVVFLTINLEDVKDPVIKFEKDSVYFKGTGGAEKKLYEITIPLYQEIDPEKSTSFNRGRCIEILLAKANQKEPYWPSLLKDKKKCHWLKCDFNKWNDEDDSGDERTGFGGEDPSNFEEVMRQMGGLGDTRPSFNDLEDEDEADSDDEPIPDLEHL